MHREPAAPRRRRPPLPAAAVAIAAAMILAGCASGAERPSLPSESRAGRPESVVPEGVTEMREEMASMRAENREAMDATLIQSRPLSESPTETTFGRFLGALGRGVADVASILAFGL